METIMLVPGMQDEVKAAVEGKFEVFDMTGYDKPSDIPGLDPAKVRGTITRGESHFGDELMSQLPNLEISANFGVGYDGIDVVAAKKRGVMVTNTPDVLTDETANTSLMLTLAVTRRLPTLDRIVRSNGWPDVEKELLTNSIVQRKAGVLGLGRIGRGIADRLTACGAIVSYCDPIKQDVPYQYFADPVAMAKHCDIFVVACLGGDATYRIVNAEVLEAIGPEGYLVNAARGSIVDEAATIAALKAGKIAGAGLDVFENEPHVPAELRAMENVVLTPHCGSGTIETRGRMAGLAVANLEAHFAGKPVLTLVPEHRE
ncbi:MAG: 2-hydroxyacid dehydrogenase [Rhodospirillales bacterium]|jgi:hydroxypyruvate reductase|nr:2-hydroxyacid dehydrogenase [Rhodospirillales bacterium]